MHSDGCDGAGGGQEGRTNRRYADTYTKQLFGPANHPRHPHFVFVARSVFSALPVFRHRPRGKCALSMHAKSSFLALGGLIDARLRFVRTVVAWPAPE